MTGDRGLTLIELVVALALLGTALAAIAGTVQGAYRTMFLVERTLEVQQNARIAVDRIVEELRWAEAVLDDARCAGLCAERITVRISPHNPRRPGEAYVVTFQRDDAQRELERRLGGAVNNLAGSIESLIFRYFGPDGTAALRPQDVARVEVAVVAAAPSPGASRRVVTDVFLRNRLAPSPAP